MAEVYQMLFSLYPLIKLLNEHRMLLLDLYFPLFEMQNHFIVHINNIFIFLESKHILLKRYVFLICDVCAKGSSLLSCYGVRTDLGRQSNAFWQLPLIGVSWTLIS